MKKMSLPLLACLLTLLMTWSGIVTHAQVRSLIIPGSLTFSGLSTEQKAAYTAISSMPQNGAMYLVNLDQYSACEVDGKILIDLSFIGCGPMVFNMRNVSYRSDDDYSYYGEYVSADSTDTVCRYANIMLSGQPGTGMMFGSINVGDISATFQPLGGRAYVMTLVNNYILPATELDHITGLEPSVITEAYLHPIGLDCDYNRDAKVLLLYPTSTLSAKGISAGNYQNYIDGYSTYCVFQMNTVLSNSGITRQISLAGAEELKMSDVNYYFGYIEGDLATVGDNTFIQSRRDYYSADYVIALTRPNLYISPTTGAGFYGRVRGVGCYNLTSQQFDEKYSVGVVDIDKNIFDYIFSHESSHIFDCHHEEDPQYPTVGYNFAKRDIEYTTWLFWKHRFKTVVSTPYNPGEEPFRMTIPYLSNPDIDYEGEETGEDVRNNARRFNEMYNTIGSIRPEATNYSTMVEIQRPFNETNTNCTVKFIASEVCGVGPYTHHWYATWGGQLWMDLGTGTQKTITGGYGTIVMRLISTSGSGGSMQTYQQEVAVNTNCRLNQQPHHDRPGQGVTGIAEQDMLLNNMTISPNPNNGNFELEISSGADTKANLIVTDVLGKVVYSKADVRIQEGTSSISVSLQNNLSAGIYHVRVNSGSFNLTGKIIIR